MRSLKSVLMLGSLGLLFASCVPKPAREVTRSLSDEKVLADFAILRPKWKDPTKADLRHHSVDASVTEGSHMENVGMKGYGFGDTLNLGIVLNPGPCSIKAGSVNSVYRSSGRLSFTAQKGKIYSFRITIRPELKGTDRQHRWEVYEEDSGKIVFSNVVEARYSPMIYPLIIVE